MRTGDTRGGHRRVCTLVAVVVCLLTGFATADADPGIEVYDQSILSVDGDLVVLTAGDGSPTDPARIVPVAAPSSGGSTMAASSGGGYTLIRSTATLRGSYVVRLVPSSGVETLRSHFSAATSAASSSPSVNVSTSGQPGTHAPGPGQIDVIVSSSSPCTGAWLACGGPVMAGREIRSGKVWVHPRLLTRSPNDIRNTVMHELGHTLGLGHYSGTYSGRPQVMHPTSFAAPTYRSGDRNGFARLVSNLPPMSGSVENLRYAAGRVRLDLVVRNMDPGAVAEVTAGGDLVEAVGLREGRNSISAPLAGGRSELCVELVSPRTATHVRCVLFDAPMHPFGNLESVEATRLGVRVQGWAVDPQTNEPISIRLVASVLSLSHRADGFRPDVGAAKPDYGSMHGFDVSRPMPPGSGRVCVYAVNVGVGLDQPLGCRDVKVPIL